MNKTLKRFTSLLLAVAISIVPATISKADNYRVVTLGSDLSDEQRELILNYLGIEEGQVDVIEVTNEDEHRLLDGIATQQQIGTHAYSCAYIEPTESGGIHIKTVNLNWVTCEMIRNALVTSGITNCNVVAVSPMEASGTGSLTGIFKAYEKISGRELDDYKKELASEELIATCELAGVIGQDEASTLVSEVKYIIMDSITSEEEIAALLDKYITDNGLEVTEEQKVKLVELFAKLSKQEYDIEEIRQAYADIKQTLVEVKEATEKTMNIFQKIWNAIKTFFQKLFGTYEEIEAEQEIEAIKTSLGILTETNDDLIDGTIVVTVTEDDEILGKVNGQTVEVEEEPEEKEEKHHWYDFILGIFNSGNNKIEEEEPEEVVTEQETPKFNTTTETEVETEDTTEQVEETESEETTDSEDTGEDTTTDSENTNETGSTSENEEEQSEEEENTGLLDYVTYDLDENANNESNGQQGNSLDDVTSR